MSLNFLNVLREANRRRLPRFKGNAGQPAHSEPDGSDWSIAEWTNAAAGEMGEACNIAKKIRRGDFNQSLNEGRAKLAQELCDAVIYIDLCMLQIEKDLTKELMLRFNEKSDEVGAGLNIVQLDAHQYIVDDDRE